MPGVNKDACTEEPQNDVRETQAFVPGRVTKFFQDSNVVSETQSVPEPTSSLHSRTVPNVGGPSGTVNAWLQLCEGAIAGTITLANTDAEDVIPRQPPGDDQSAARCLPILHDMLLPISDGIFFDHCRPRAGMGATSPSGYPSRTSGGSRPRQTTILADDTTAANYIIRIQQAADRACSIRSLWGAPSAEASKSSPFTPSGRGASPEALVDLQQQRRSKDFMASKDFAKRVLETAHSGVLGCKLSVQCVVWLHLLHMPPGTPYRTWEALCAGDKYSLLSTGHSNDLACFVGLEAALVGLLTRSGVRPKQSRDPRRSLRILSPRLERDNTQAECTVWRRLIGTGTVATGAASIQLTWHLGLGRLRDASRTSAEKKAYAGTSAFGALQAAVQALRTGKKRTRREWCVHEDVYDAVEKFATRAGAGGIPRMHGSLELDSGRRMRRGHATGGAAVRGARYQLLELVARIEKIPADVSRGNGSSVAAPRRVWNSQLESQDFRDKALYKASAERSGDEIGREGGRRRQARDVATVDFATEERAHLSGEQRGSVSAGTCPPEQGRQTHERALGVHRRRRQAVYEKHSPGNESSRGDLGGAASMQRAYVTSSWHLLCSPKAPLTVGAKRAWTILLPSRDSASSNRADQARYFLADHVPRRDVSHSAANTVWNYGLVGSGREQNERRSLNRVRGSLFRSRRVGAKRSEEGSQMDESAVRSHSGWRVDGPDSIAEREWAQRCLRSRERAGLVLKARALRFRREWGRWDEQWPQSAASGGGVAIRAAAWRPGTLGKDRQGGIEAITVDPLALLPCNKMESHRECVLKTVAASLALRS
jgi:hypothetical protein